LFSVPGFEKDESQADFLRHYSLDRLPNDAKLRRRAAEFLRKQGKEDLARQVEVRGNKRAQCPKCYNFVVPPPVPRLHQGWFDERGSIPLTEYPTNDVTDAGYFNLTALTPKSRDHKRIQLDRLYQKIIDDLDELLPAVGLKPVFNKMGQGCLNNESKVPIINRITG
jgi:hypothetical protein